MADYTLACDSVLVLNPPVPYFVVSPPTPEIVQVSTPSTVIEVHNPPQIRVVPRPAKSINVVLPVQGPPGQDGQDGFYYEHDQILASAGWTVNHNLGKYPNVAVILGGETIGVAVQHLDVNTIYIPFAIPVTGKAICS